MIGDKASVNPTRRRLRLALSAALVVLVGVVTLQASRRSVTGSGWTEVNADDRRVRGIFLTLRNRGLTAALDSLEHQAGRDSVVLRSAHQLAHALGREAFASTDRADTIIASCRPAFSSGCYHGVVEASLTHGRIVDMTALERMCAGRENRAVRGSLFECVHGVGHGVLGARGGEVAAALRDCDALSSEPLQSSCHEGVFMEAITNAVAGLGHGPVHAHTGTHAGHGPGLAVSSEDPYLPCRVYRAEYGQACWLFQGFVILRSVGFDGGRALRLCDRAPAGWVNRCYQSVGHQLAGLFQRDDGWVIDRCRSGRPELGAQCAAGAVLVRIAEDWTGQRAQLFCEHVPESWREDCRDAYERRMTALRAGSGAG